MTTANDLISAALGLTLTRSADVPLEPDELQDAILQLNNMMTSWNLAVGYTIVSSPNGLITTPDYALDAMIQNLAVRLAPGFGGLVDADLRQNAREAKRDLLKIVVTIGPARYPSTLPRGSGNTRTSTRNRIFYPPSAGEIAQEQGGSILLEE